MVFPLVCYLWSVFRDETQLTEYTEVCSMNKIKMNSFFSLFFFFFVLILSYFCVPVPWGSQKRKLLQAAAEVWKGVKNLSSWPLHPLSTSPCPPILLSQSVLLFRSPHLKGVLFYVWTNLLNKTKTQPTTALISPLVLSLQVQLHPKTRVSAGPQKGLRRYDKI